MTNSYILLLGVDDVEGGSVARPRPQLPDRGVELADKAVAAVDVVVVALHADVAILVPVAQGEGGHGEALPRGVQLVLDDFGAVDHHEAAVLGGARELEERIGAAKEVFLVQLPAKMAYKRVSTQP